MRNYPDGKVGEPGDVSFISQSGTHTINFCVQAAAHGVRVNMAASIGNVLILEAADYIDLMAADPATKVIGMYIEGVRDGRRFFESLRAAADAASGRGMEGRCDRCGRARDVFAYRIARDARGAVERAGAPGGRGRVGSLDAMLDAVELLSRGRKVAGRAMGLVAMTGGQSVVITDTFAAAGLEIPALSDASYEELKSILQRDRRQLSQSARRWRNDRRRRAYRADSIESSRFSIAIRWSIRSCSRSAPDFAQPGGPRMKTKSPTLLDKLARVRQRNRASRSH